MPSRLLFADTHAARDALTFAGRAAALGPDSALRLRAQVGTLAMSTAVLAPRTLLEDVPTVLGLRALPVDPELECDIVIPAGGLVATESDMELALPEHAVSAPWAGVAPPRGGWREQARVEASVLAARAQWGMSAVARALPAEAGEEVLRGVRARIWGEADDQLAGLPRAAAFAASTLGFVHGEETAVLREAAGWSRLTLRRGHVLVRRTVRAGLTPVRRTGAS